MKPKWLFEKTPPMGGATGEAFLNTLQATGMAPDAVLAREAIQNSCDAATDPGKSKVRVVFRRTDLTGNHKGEFLEALNLRDEFIDRKRKLGLQAENCLSGLDDDGIPLPLLYIEDYHTHGLFGPPHDQSSHFFRLLLSLGDSSKSRDTERSGGSYGYGKSVYSNMSRIRTIVAYSVFDARKGHVAGARIMGCAYFDTHTYRGDSFSGRAWFGRIQKKKGVVDPVEDEAAHALADGLGFGVRAASETGTSILIVDCTVDTESLASSIEEWWWPCLIENKLDVELFSHGSPAVPPRPRLRDDLKPFMECYDLALRRTSPKDRSQVYGGFSKVAGKPLGAYGLQSLGAESDPRDGPSDKANTVALIRSTRMVVAYYAVSNAAAPVMGTFVASPEIDKFLRQSEPASHDKWDPQSSRLESEETVARHCVLAVIDRIKARMRRFASESLPPPPKSDAPPRLLQQMLGTLFRPPAKPGKGGGGSPADPVIIRYRDQPHAKISGKDLRTVGAFRVELAPDFDAETAEVLVTVHCVPMDDDGASGEEHIPVKVVCGGLSSKAAGDDGATLRVVLDKESRPVFEFESEPYNADWTTRVRVEVSTGANS